MRTLPVSAAPAAVQALVCPKRKITLYGRSAAALSFRFAAEVACEGGQAMFLCGDNRFDPYAIARYARARGGRRDLVLSRILIARAFTGYQFDELIRRLGAKEFSGDFSGPVILTGICSAFLDEDIPANEAARLFYRSLWRLKALAERGVALLLTETREIANSRRAYFLRDLYRASDFVFHLDAQTTFRLEMREALPAADRRLLG